MATAITARPLGTICLTGAPALGRPRSGDPARPYLLASTYSSDVLGVTVGEGTVVGVGVGGAPGPRGGSALLAWEMIAVAVACAPEISSARPAIGDGVGAGCGPRPLHPQSMRASSRRVHDLEVMTGTARWQAGRARPRQALAGASPGCRPPARRTSPCTRPVRPRP